VSLIFTPYLNWTTICWNNQRSWSWKTYK